MQLHTQTHDSVDTRRRKKCAAVFRGQKGRKLSPRAISTQTLIQQPAPQMFRTNSLQRGLQLNVNQFEWTATIMFIAMIANEHEPIRFARLENRAKQSSEFRRQSRIHEIRRARATFHFF
jgi:hypothetical protein